MTSYYGNIALVGRPNVGKSTLLNQLLGETTSIVTAKPHTTRATIRGVLTQGDHQAVFIDTPGLNENPTRQLNRAMNRAISRTIRDADLVLWLVTCGQWATPENWLLDYLNDRPVYLVVNKIDTLKSRDDLYPFVSHVKTHYPFHAIHALSAKTAENVPDFREKLLQHLPEGRHRYRQSPSEEQLHLAELIRQPMMIQLKQELPYTTQVIIERLEKTPRLVTLHANLWVERASQKKIVIGKGGQRLKAIGMAARRQLEQHFQCKVMLKLWVQVNEGWLDQPKHFPGDLS